MHPVAVAIARGFWIVAVAGIVVNAVDVPDPIAVGLPALAMLAGAMLVVHASWRVWRHDGPRRAPFLSEPRR